jgi:hypothetical protein
METPTTYRRDRERHSGGHRGARDWDDAKIEDYCRRLTRMIREARSMSADAETDEGRAFYEEMSGQLVDAVNNSLPFAGCAEYVRERIERNVADARTGTL